MSGLQSKDEIKDRLIRRAAETWGVDEMEIESSFDPIVDMLLDACAHEFEGISNSIKTSRTTVTERLVDILTPETSVSAKPAHAVMHAIPLDSNIKVNGHIEFIHRKRKPIFKESAKASFEDFSFCPAGEFHISNCNLEYIVYPNKIIKYHNQQNLVQFGTNDFTAESEVNCIYLGIKPGIGIKNINQLLCYFDILNFEKKGLLAHHIGIADWSLNGEPLDIVKGYNEQGDGKNEYSGYINEGVQSKIRFYESYVKAYYENQFYTINKGLEVEKNLKYYPDTFSDYISERKIKEFDQQLLWIKIKFSTVVSTEMLENLHLHINCFPALNKKPRTISKRLQPYFNIVPLVLENELFCDVQEISGDSGNSYFIQDRDQNNHKNPGAYLRYGGVSRFDERDASELLNYTLDRIKEDTVAFSALGNDFIDGNLKSLKKIVTRIEQKIDQKGFSTNRIPYVIINRDSVQNNRDKNIYITYWTTAGENANKINPYEKLNEKSGAAFQPDSLNFITGSLGGKNEPSPSEKVHAYREQILSKGRIVTRQDIVKHCFNIYKGSITEVKVEKGVMISADFGGGYTPTSDIYLKKNSDIDYTNEDWEHLKKELLIGLGARSANILPFRVFYRN